MHHNRDNFNKKIFGVFKKKDFFLIFLVIFFVIYLVSSFVKDYLNDRFYNDANIKTITQYHGKSIFNVKELNIKDLKDRIILINAYNINDFSSISSIDLANKLEKIYKNKVVIIDVITDNIEFDNNVIINYIIKNNIERPVLNIFDLKIDASLENKNRYFILIDNKGIIVDIFTDDKINQQNIKNSIDKLLSKKPKLNTEKLVSMDLEKNKNPESFIKSLEHIKYISKIKGTNKGPYFIISDIKGRRIYFLTVNGNIVNQLGNGTKGNSDGIGADVSFCAPSDITVFDQNILYIADTCNNSIREVNLKTMEVSTLIKDNELLKNPISLAILDDNLIISTVGNARLLKYNLKNNELSLIKCNVCNSDILKLNKFDGNVYFLDKNGINILDNTGKIDKFLDFKNIKNSKNIQINEKSNFHIDDTGFYIVDKFENRIIKINNDEIIEYSKNNGKKIYNIPTDIIDFKDKLYVTNESNKKLIQLDKNTKNIKLINITFGYEYNKIKNVDEQFLNINNTEEILLKSGSNNKIYLDLKNGYSFERMAPQSLSIYLENFNDNTAVLIKNYSKTDILNNKVLTLPDLEDNAVYYIKGRFYYCNFDKKTPCLIKNYTKKIISNSRNTENKIIVDFLY